MEQREISPPPFNSDQAWQSRISPARHTHMHTHTHLGPGSWATQIQRILLLFCHTTLLLFSPSFFSTSTVCRCTAWGTLKAVGILLWGGDGEERQNSEPHVLRQEVLGNMWSSLYESRWKPQAVKHQRAYLLSVNKLKRVYRSARCRRKRSESKTNELRDFLDCRSVSVSVCVLLRCFKWASAVLMVTGLTSQVSPSISLSDATCLLFIYSEIYNCLLKNNREDEPQRDAVKFVHEKNIYSLLCCCSCFYFWFAFFFYIFICWVFDIWSIFSCYERCYTNTTTTTNT